MISDLRRVILSLLRLCFIAMEGGAKAFCDEFNCILRQIDLYNDHEYSRNDYIGDFNELCKVD